MVDRFIMLILAMAVWNASAQNGKGNPFPRVAVPDSIAVKLREAYKSTTELRCNAEANVYNLIDRFNYDFKDGIYSFRGMGPHFPRRIFIFDKGQLFIFDSAGFNEPQEVIREFSQAIDSLNLSPDQIVQYSKTISKYLEQESGETYGREKVYP
ncbi:hypothetical protein [uncultured Alistipes sp.]|uniref:hypothetical protein n=1 Tax=uncultured Alistipes sp. TaxID=538949 RepID=UPI002593B877|nr:hypothetical protein [uncultured Alistipes sp.]